MAVIAEGGAALLANLPCAACNIKAGIILDDLNKLTEQKISKVYVVCREEDRCDGSLGNITSWLRKKDLDDKTTYLRGHQRILLSSSGELTTLHLRSLNYSNVFLDFTGRLLGCICP